MTIPIRRMAEPRLREAVFIPDFCERKRIPSGGGRRSSPLFLARFVLSLFLGAWIGPLACQPRGTAENGLSAFDRLAEEASYLNKRGETERVIALLEPRMSDEKNDSVLFFNELGVALRQSGRMSEAVQVYRRALSLDPHNPVLRKNLAEVYYLNREYPKAVELCREALRSNPGFRQAHSTLALALYRMERYKEALEEFEIVLRLNPGDGEAGHFREAIRRKLAENAKR